MTPAFTHVWTKRLFRDIVAADKTVNILSEWCRAAPPLSTNYLAKLSRCLSQNTVRGIIPQWAENATVADRKSWAEGRKESKQMSKINAEGTALWQDDYGRGREGGRKGWRLVHPQKTQSAEIRYVGPLLPFQRNRRQIPCTTASDLNAPPRRTSPTTPPPQTWRAEQAAIKQTCKQLKKIIQGKVRKCVCMTVCMCVLVGPLFFFFFFSF